MFNQSKKPFKGAGLIHLFFRGIYLFMMLQHPRSGAPNPGLGHGLFATGQHKWASTDGHAVQLA